MMFTWVVHVPQGKNADGRVLSISWFFDYAVSFCAGPLVPQTPSPAPPLCPNTPKNTSTLNSNFFEYVATPMKDFFERNQAYRQHRLHRAEIDREELEMELASVREEMSKERAKLFQLEDQVERQRELLRHDQPSPSDKLVRKLESRTLSLNRMNKLCDELEEEKTFLQERVDEMTKENEVLQEKFESRMLNFETQKKELNDMVCEAKKKESEQASMMKEYEALLVEAQHQRVCFYLVILLLIDGKAFCLEG
uniref:Uncharacterized protein n=1 Tax=Eptatretus burgeri TaxID=7764 RepID=A0A8C4R8A0_EPTBU